MYRSSSVLCVLVLASSFALVACGDDSGPAAATDANIVFNDAPIPDAPTPDAFVCNMTDCGNNQCVDLDTDEFHCGECDMACSNGQECLTGGCSCPTVTAPAKPAALLGQVDTTQIPGLAIAFTVFATGASADAMVIAYDPVAQATNMDIALPSDGFAPSVLYGYNVDIGAQTVQTPYAATAGTLNFNTACAVGMDATLTNVTFSQINSLTDPTPLPGGCTFTADAIHVVIGEPCPTDGTDAMTTDAMTTDAMTTDAGVLDAAP